MSITQSSVRRSIPKLNQTVMLLAYLNTNQTALNGNAWNKINLNKVVYDVGSNFDTSLFKFTAPVTGLYKLDGVILFTSVIATKRYLTSLYKNGVLLVSGQQHSSLANDLSARASVEVFLQQGDYIELYAYPEVGGGTNTVAASSGSTSTILNIRLLTKEGIRQ